MFSEQELTEIGELQKRYETPVSALLPILWRLQEKNGWIDDNAIDIAAELCKVPRSHVVGVVSFYTMYFEKPMGRFHLQVCTNVSCLLCGGEKIYETMKAELGIGHLDRDPSGTFSLEEVECMGACGGAPMIAINEQFYERSSVDEAKSFVEFIRTNNQLPKPKLTIQLPDLNEASNG